MKAHAFCRALVAALMLSTASLGNAGESLRFVQSEGGSFAFDTGVLRGVLRQDGKSIGLIPVTFSEDGSSIAAGEGLFNHYRVFTHGVRYGYGARRWPSTAELRADGSVEVHWPSTSDRPFELRSTYTWVTPDSVDVVTTVSTESKLEAFEVFLASYYSPTFTDSRVWASRDPRGGIDVGFVPAERQFGEWLAFPRDETAAAMIGDGRWELEPHPLEWTMMPSFAWPLAIRRDPDSGLTVVTIARPEDCFGVFTPYGEEGHMSKYLSLFGYTIEAGQSASAGARLVVLSDPTEAQILEVAEEYLEAARP